MHEGQPLARCVYNFCFWGRARTLEKRAAEHRTQKGHSLKQQKKWKRGSLTSIPALALPCPIIVRTQYVLWNLYTAMQLYSYTASYTRCSGCSLGCSLLALLQRRKATRISIAILRGNSLLYGYWARVGQRGYFNKCLPKQIINESGSQDFGAIS